MKPVMTAIAAVLVAVATSLAQPPEKAANEKAAKLIPDALRGQFGVLAVQYHEVLDRCIRERPDFEVSDISKSTSASFIGGQVTTYTYKVKLPSFMTETIKPWSHSREFQELFLALSTEASRDPRRSFYSELVEASCDPTDNRTGYSGRPLDALWAKDWKRWEKERSEDHWPGEGLGLDPQITAKSQMGYWHDLFLQSLSDDAREAITGDPKWPTKHAFGWECYRPSREWVTQPVPDVADPDWASTHSTAIRMTTINRAVVAFAYKWDRSALAALSDDRAWLQMWAQYLINTEDRDLPPVINAFLCYASTHGEKSVFSEMALSTFIARGYAYNERTGVYDLNWIGKQLLDYVIAHPVPRALEVCRVLRKHSDERALLEMVRLRHPDCEGWDDFEKKVRASHEGPIGGPH